MYKTLTRPRHLITALAGLLTLCLSLTPAGAVRPGRQEERRVDKDTFRNEPIEIVGLKNKKGKFKLGQKITDDDNWLDGFTLTVVNRSSKNIDSLVIDIWFPRPANHKTSSDPPYFYTLHFNPHPLFPEYALRDRTKVIRPGETADLVISDEDYQQNLRYLAQAAYPPSIKRVELVIHTVGFEDGTVWMGGPVRKRDPKNPYKLLDEEEQTSGRERRRPAKFFAPAPPAPASFVKTSLTLTHAAQFTPPCGQQTTTLRDWCDKQFPEGEPFTCSKERDTINTSSPVKIRELVNGLRGCLKWDVSRNVYLSCGALEDSPRARECSTPPGAGVCTTPGLDGACPPNTYPDGFGMCCPGLLAGDGGSCPDPPSTFYCGDILPETNCPYYFISVGTCYSPVLLDIDGDGFSLTGAAGGVHFDIDGNPDGARERVSWTAAGSDDAWLALDRDGDGLITSGRELFGNLTRQPAGRERNGFLALAEFDKVSFGGNGDGVINDADAVFPSLRLWRDSNRDGVSQPAELHPLPTLEVARLHLDYKESKRTDEHGNRFRYRAKVDDARGAKTGRWAWDVFLLAGQ